MDGPPLTDSYYLPFAKGVAVGSHNTVNNYGVDPAELYRRLHEWERSRRVYVVGPPGWWEAAGEVCRRVGLEPVPDMPDLPVAERRRLAATCGLVVLLPGGGAPEDWARELPGVLVLPPATEADSLRRGLFSVLLDARVRSVPPPADLAALTMPQPPALCARPRYVGNTPFTGRAQHLRTLDAWARDRQRPVLVVEAIGGTGKSALTWEWTRGHDGTNRFAGRFWWSFYGGSASITQFLRELYCYLTRTPMREIERLDGSTLIREVMAHLSDRPYLVVLDGFERLLHAYHRFDPSKLRDDEVEPDKRGLIEPLADTFVRELIEATPSKVLISSRLMPAALERRFDFVNPVQRIKLPGLDDDEVVRLLQRLQVRATPPESTAFFGPLGNHPLLIALIAALVRDFRPAPGDFDRWLVDPAGGRAFTVRDSRLTQRQSHILEVAFAGLPAPSRELLGLISVFTSEVAWATLDAINPFRRRGGVAPELDARVALDAALHDLEQRGLLWWDRPSNSYDLHPLIRAYAHDQLDRKDRVRANEEVGKYFQALPPENTGRAASVDDLHRTIAIFVALVGAERHQEAEGVWRELSEPLTKRLGAYTTVTELLAPMAEAGSPRLRNDLSLAYSMTGRYAEAIALVAGDLDSALRWARVGTIIDCLSALRRFYYTTGQLLAANRCLDLRRQVAALFKVEQQYGDTVESARFELDSGRLDQARAMLQRADRLRRRARESWSHTTARYLLLYIRLLEGKLDPAELEPVGDWDERLGLLNLRWEYFARVGDWPAVLDAAEQMERLVRDAGGESTPALQALPLAGLGRPDDARRAIAESVERLPRMHPAHLPHNPLARAYGALGERDEAVAHAREAYRLAWADGPPHWRYWELRDLEHLFAWLGEPVPRLPPTHPGRIEVPHQELVIKFLDLNADRRR
ncbi:hypothetical protein [Dactylosporangium sp. NPDC049140]|uniref:hypothetical protein n=1 Tax=Dactylosporangium sp. NPDC049140 TaxID=3155647 RepID=UPI0033EFB4EB